MSKHTPRQPHDDSVFRHRPRRSAATATNERLPRGGPRHGTRVGRSIRNVSIAMLLAASLGCTATAPPAPGSFIEEFEGFPIFHGDPGRPYRVLGGVYRPEAAARGASPMKRAAVAEARRLGAQAILIGPPPAPGGVTTPPDAPQPPPAGAENKWEHAVAIQLLD